MLLTKSTIHEKNVAFRSQFKLFYHYIQFLTLRNYSQEGRGKKKGRRGGRERGERGRERREGERKRGKCDEGKGELTGSAI